MRELAVRAIDPAPLLDQVQDRLLLPDQQAMDRGADRRAVLQRAGLAQAGAPAVRAHVGELEHRARAHLRPAGRGRGVDQAQQLELGLRAHTSPDRAEKPERCLPRCSESSTASSLIASESRAFSARSSSSSTCSTDAGRPGREAANAASAPSLASRRSLITVETSTPHLRAASACESCCDVTSTNTCHFSSGDSCRPLRRGPLDIDQTSWNWARTASQAWVERGSDLYRRLRRKPPAPPSARPTTTSATGPPASTPRWISRPAR